jgi:hypothetical protein
MIIDSKKAEKQAVLNLLFRFLSQVNRPSLTGVALVRRGNTRAINYLTLQFLLIL